MFALDLPGHGKSEGRGLQSIPAYAGTVLEWLDSIGLHKALFVGHSLGGGIALELAIHHAEHVLGLGLVGSAPRLKVNPEILANASSPTTFFKAIETITSWSYSHEAPAHLIELSGQRLAETRSSVFYGDLLACEAFNVTAQIDQIHQPTLVICGSEDRMTPPRSSQLLAGIIPGARLEIIPAAGHNVMLEQPQAVASVLAEFLAGVPYQPG